MSQIDYKPRFTRRPKEEGGGYIAHFGKGKNKLNAIITKVKNGWHVSKGDSAPRMKTKPTPTLKVLKEDWGDWARMTWNRRTGPPPPPTIKPAGPPRHVPGPKVAAPMKPVPEGELPPDLEYNHAADPFSPTHKYPTDFPDAYKRNQLTPVGALIEVYDWLLLHRDKFGRIAETKPMFETVKECVHREDPDEYRRVTKKRSTE
jgi:hypothetical protein